MAQQISRLSVPQFVAKKARGERITMLTAYDFSMASFVDAAGIDSILVGDSLGMVVQGQETTLPVTLDEMIYHGRCVCRAAKRALVVVDMPFGSYHSGSNQTVANAARILKETGCQAVKLEGGADQSEAIRSLVQAGIPVMAHVGLRPQSVHQLGGYRVQRDSERLLHDAAAAQEAGAFSIVIECVPSDLAAEITQQVAIPTIGIGAGAGCDGQVLVLNDMLGLTATRVPRFVKQFDNLGERIEAAVKQYCRDVQLGEFPGAEHTFE